MSDYYLSLIPHLHWKKLEIEEQFDKKFNFFVETLLIINSTQFSLDLPSMGVFFDYLHYGTY